MKSKWLLLISSALLLAACGSESTDKDEQSESESSIVESVEESSVASSSIESVEEDTVAEALYQVNPNTFSIEPIADAPEQVALLTFDDAPQEYSIAIAQKVKAKNANAIFFVMGQFLEDPANMAIIREIHEMGFEIGNHSYSHPLLTDLTAEEQAEELLKTNDLIEEATGARPRFFRAPHGAYNDETLAIVQAEQMINMNWSYGYDWEEQYMNGPALADIMVNTELLYDGANLLMHDREWTAEAIDSIIDGLRAKGFELVDPTTIDSAEREIASE